MQPYYIAPSLLAADFARLGEEADAALKAGADMLHLDVMDNHYVPNLTVGPLVCKALRNYGITAPIDVHLMVKPVDKLIVDFAQAGASYITFHPEASEHIDRSLALIREQGCKAGLALNPATSIHSLDYVLDKLDMILVMSVNPGFGGQQLIPAAFDKLKKIRALIADKSIRLAIDGGIKIENIAKAATAGADTFIVGTALYGTTDYAKTIVALREQLASVK